MILHNKTNSDESLYIGKRKEREREKERYNLEKKERRF